MEKTLSAHSGDETENTDQSNQKKGALTDEALLELMELQDTAKSDVGGAL
ncbi:MAG: hypothetical protein HY072_10140 [Deltaproteobacteria bacterium]|nr:hypothetical protein [Deltaproteobacteria bacterium]